MNLSRMIKNPLVIGTLFLTISGALSRIIGFFYRIFLSHTIGAEGVGIYQLIFPVYVLCFALTSAGIQSAISKYVAEAAVKKGDGTNTLEELGDLLFSVVNVSRFIKTDAEEALYNACEKFIDRFTQVEKLAKERNIEMSHTNLSELDSLWEEVKIKSEL